MNEDVIPDEETPLLAPETSHQVTELAKASTPLPKLQLSILLFSSLTEPFSATVVQPFINQMIGGFDVVGGNTAKVGYCVGLMYTLFFVAEAAMVLHWSRLSDRIGRKPVLLTGLFGIAISMTCFGLSTSFWMLVVSRSFQGLMNGNTGVMKSMLTEMSDPTNIAQVFALVASSWAIGATIAPIIGGVLFFLRETAPVKTSFAFGRRPRISSVPLLEANHSSNDESAVPKEAVLPLSALLTPNVILAGGNYCLLAMFDIAASTLLALFLASPADGGGVGLEPHAIGLLLGAYGIANGLFQGLTFAPLVRGYGIKKVFLGGMLAFLPFSCSSRSSTLLRTRSVGRLWSGR